MILDPFCKKFPEDIPLLQDTEHCGFRVVCTGETFAAADIGERSPELSGGIVTAGNSAIPQELVICPTGVPRSRTSVLRSCFREFCDFLVSSSFGAINGASPSLFVDGGPDASNREDQWRVRNLSVAPMTFHLQVVLLEIILSLAAVVAPRYARTTANA